MVGHLKKRSAESDGPCGASTIERLELRNEWRELNSVTERCKRT
jgi:hypothetical protein